MSEPALFELQGEDVFMPGPRARGPWDINALHGGPVAALLMRGIELLPSVDDAPMHVARLTVELLRPAPVAPLQLRTEVQRPGRKVQLGAASLWAGDVEVARAVALRMRAAEVAIPELPLEALGDPGPSMAAGQAKPRREDWEAFHNEGVEMRFVSGHFDERGPSAVWMRLRQPVVAGEEPTPAMRVAAVGDFGNGVSSVVPWDRYLFINPELTIHLMRMPVGEWVCLDARTYMAPSDGIGFAESALYDEQGRIGRAVQALFVDRR